MAIKNTYWKQLKTSVRTLFKGLRLTLRHLSYAGKQAQPLSISDKNYFKNNDQGLMTVQYPHEMIPVPDNGRYRLHNEIEDCIVCDKCAKVCPVDCIAIEPIKSPEVYGYTSDGTPKRIHAAKFDIDMAKCCFCGLCTVVCPTECITMTKTFDFSEYDVQDHTYAFATMSEQDIQEKKSVWEAFEKTKQKPAATQSDRGDEGESVKPAVKPKKPVFKPRIKPGNSDKSI